MSYGDAYRVNTKMICDIMNLYRKPLDVTTLSLLVTLLDSYTKMGDEIDKDKVVRGNIMPILIKALAHQMLFDSKVIEVLRKELFSRGTKAVVRAPTLLPQNKSRQKNVSLVDPVIPTVTPDKKEVPECIICMEGERTNAAFPCGHCCYCDHCVKRYKKKLDEGNEVSCPTCRGVVTRFVRLSKDELDNLIHEKDVRIGNTKIYLGSPMSYLHLELADDKRLGLENLLWKLRGINDTTRNLIDGGTVGVDDKYNYEYDSE